MQKFSSDPEGIFAMVLEDDGEVLKWVKPALAQFASDTSLSWAATPIVWFGHSTRAHPLGDFDKTLIG